MKPTGPRPLKTNMEPENHPFEKENHLPNLHFWVLGFDLIFRGELAVCLRECFLVCFPEVVGDNLSTMLVWIWGCKLLLPATGIVAFIRGEGQISLIKLDNSPIVRLGRSFGASFFFGAICFTDPNNWGSGRFPHMTRVFPEVLV